MDGTNWLEFAMDQRNVGCQLAAGLSVVPITAAARAEYALVTKDAAGSVLVEREKKERVRSYQAGSLAALVAIVCKFSSKPQAESRGPEPTITLDPKMPRKFVFVDYDAIVALLDEGDGYETVTFTPKMSDGMETIEKLASGTGAMQQKGILDVLRRQINGVYEPSDLVNRLRVLKFDSSTGGQSTVRAGDESMSRAVVARVTGVDALPDEVKLTVPYFDNVEDVDLSLLNVTIDACLDVEPSSQAFLLRPKAGELEKAKRLVLNTIVRLLQCEFEGRPDVAVFLGKPGA